MHEAAHSFGLADTTSDPTSALYKYYTYRTGLSAGDVSAIQALYGPRLPDAFTRVVGKPRSGQCAVFPVMGGQRVIAVVYADNGPSNRAIEELDILELAAAQAGLALENELLRRQRASTEGSIARRAADGDR